MITLIPNKFHFIQLKGKRKFGLHHAIAIKSCHEVNKPDVINIYYDEEPSGKHWKSIKHLVNEVKINPPTEIFGKPVKHLAHKSDVIRLQVLLEEGGIYCDTDTIFVKPYEFFQECNLVLGEQGENGTEGICPAVIMSEPDSKFIKEWFIGFKEHFHGGDPGTVTWCTHSVMYPRMIIPRFSDYVTMANFQCFFYPMYHREHLKELFEECRVFPNAFSFHLWETCSQEYLNKLTPEYINSVDTTYNLIARKYL